MLAEQEMKCFSNPEQTIIKHWSDWIWSHGAFPKSDVKQLLDTLLLKKAVEEFHSLTNDELWDLRYVMDMPLSLEGSWIQVVETNPMDETFYMHVVHIPFGKCILRSGSVLHSGHIF